MEGNKGRTALEQKDYQRKYDKKTKIVSAKYVLSDMQDYDRLMDYLKRTGQTANSFIKRLVNGFFEKGYGNYGYPIPRECEKGEYYKFDYISDESFRELERILGGDAEKYNMVLDYYDGCIKDELGYALEEKGIAFEEWVADFGESVSSGAVSLDLQGSDFKKLIEKSMGQSIGEITCG